MSSWVWNLNYELLTGLCIGIGFEFKLLLTPVYELLKIHLYLSVDPNDSDEPNALFEISTSLIWIFHYWDMNLYLLQSSYTLFSVYENPNVFSLSS